MPRRDGGGTGEATTRISARKSRQVASITEDEAQTLDESADAEQPAELSLEQRPSRRAADDEDEEAGATRAPRMDSMVLRQVRTCLDRARPDAAGVTVKVERGAVVLEGRVADDTARRKVLDLVSACSGVKLIRSRLRLIPY